MSHPLIVGLCEYLSIEPLTPNSDGLYEIVFDGNLTLEIVPVSGSQLLVRGETGELPSEEDEQFEFLKRVFERNMLLLREQRNTLSLETDTGRIWLYRLIRADRMGLPEFLDLISNFVNTLEWWRNRDDQSPAVHSAFGLMPHSFVRP